MYWKELFGGFQFYYQFFFDNDVKPKANIKFYAIFVESNWFLLFDKKAKLR